MKQTDYQGNDAFWYLDEYDLYSILDCRMVDRVIQKKWTGKYELNQTMMDFSTASKILTDKYKLFTKDRLSSELRHEMMNFNLSEKTHQYKFHVWLESMQLRFFMDMVFTICLTLAF